MKLHNRFLGLGPNLILDSESPEQAPFLDQNVTVLPLAAHSSAGRKSDQSSRRLQCSGVSGGMRMSQRTEWFCLEFSWRR